MNKKILYKLLLIFVLLIISLFINNSSSFASSDNFSRESITFTTPSGVQCTWNDTDTILNTTNILSTYKNVAIFYECETEGTPNGTWSLNIVYTNADFLGLYVGTNYTYVAGFNDDGSISSSDVFLMRKLSAGSSISSYSGSYCVSGVGKLERNTGMSNSHECTMVVYSDCDIYTINSSFKLSDDLLFQRPPLEEETPVEEKQEITLAPIMEKVETEKTLLEVVGILPLIIVVVVSLVGLRKALKMLLAVLHRA